MSRAPPLHLQDDGALIALAAAGGVQARDAYGVLVERHQSWLVRTVLFLVKDPGTADDIAQDVLVKAYAALPEYRGGAGAFRGWLRRIATNLSYNRTRDAGTRRKYEKASDMSEFLDPDSGSFEERDALVAALHAVPFAYREVLVLRYVEELSVEEVAAHLDIGLSAAKMRLKRAREAFQTHYGDAVTP